MRLKLFRATDVPAAMARVRAELGPEALILSTRRTREGVELTAALEPDPIPSRPLEPRSAQHAPLAETDFTPHPTLPFPLPDPVRAALLDFHGVGRALRAALREGQLAACLAATFRFAPLALGPDAPPLLLAGPPGAGKTLTIARLATRLVMGGTMPVVITADGRRAGAAEQLSAYTRLLGADLVVASHPTTLARGLAARPAGAPILIDTSGIDAFDPVQREEIAALASVADTAPVLVLPAGLDPAEATDLAHAYRGIGARQLVVTRLDLTRRLGGLLAAAAAGLALTEAGIGPGAADGLVPFTPDFLAERLERGQAGLPLGPAAVEQPPEPP